MIRGGEESCSLLRLVVPLGAMISAWEVYKREGSCGDWQGNSGTVVVLEAQLYASLSSRLPSASSPRRIRGVKADSMSALLPQATEPYCPPRREHLRGYIHRHWTSPQE